MSVFRICYISREPITYETKVQGNKIPMFDVTFPPVLSGNIPQTIESDTPENAFAAAKRRFPHFAHIIAVEPLYDPNANDSIRLL